MQVRLRKRSDGEKIERPNISLSKEIDQHLFISLFICLVWPYILLSLGMVMYHHCHAVWINSNDWFSLDHISNFLLPHLCFWNSFMSFGPWLSFPFITALCLLYNYSIVHHNEDCVCLPGNGKCSPGKENSRMLADMSTPNGQAVPQGPNSPNGECSININTCGWSTRNSMHTWHTV